MRKCITVKIGGKQKHKLNENKGVGEIYKFCGNRGKYAICIITLTRDGRPWRGLFLLLIFVSVLLLHLRRCFFYRRKSQMQNLDPLVVDTSVWNASDANNHLLPSGDPSQEGATLFKRSPSMRRPRTVDKKTGIPRSSVFQASNGATSLFDGMHRTGSPVGTSEFETSASANSPVELSTNHESTPNSPLDLNSQTRSLSPRAKNRSVVPVREYEIDSPVSFCETLPRSSLERGKHPQKLSSGNLSQDLNLAPVQAVEFAVAPSVDEFLSTESKETIDSGKKESESRGSSVLKEVNPQESNQSSVDGSKTKSGPTVSTTLSKTPGSMRGPDDCHESPTDQVQTKTEAPSIKAPRKKSLTPVVALDTYGLSLHETVSISSDGTHAKSEVPTKAPRRKSLAPVSAINIYEVSNTETFSVSPREASESRHELETSRKAPPRKKTIRDTNGTESYAVLDSPSGDGVQSQTPVSAPRRRDSTPVSISDVAAAASFELPEDVTLLPPDEFLTPSEVSDPDGRSAMDRCDQECQTDATRLKETEDAAVNTVGTSDAPVPFETVTPADSPKYTADYIINSADAPVFVLDPVIETLANRQDVLNVVESTVTVPDRIEVFTDSQVHANDDTVEHYVVTKPDSTEVFTDLPTEVHAPQTVEPCQVTKPEHIEVFTELPVNESENVEAYVVTKPETTEIFTDRVSDIDASQTVKPYVITKPENTDVFADSPAAVHASQTVEPYVVTKPDNNEILMESPSAVHSSENVNQYVVTKPDNTEVFSDSPEEENVSQNIEQYVVTKPDNTDIFTDSSSTTSDGR